MLKTMQILTLAMIGWLALAQLASAVDIDPSSVEFQTPAQIKWVRNAAGTNEQVVLFGDPNKPGPYVVRIKWFPGNMSRPHFHPNDRFFSVISGTWWVGTGEKYDSNHTVPVPAGSYVIHHAGKIHYDGAKDEETIIQVSGIGPATSMPAELCASMVSPDRCPSANHHSLHNPITSLAKYIGGSCFQQKVFAVGCVGEQRLPAK